MQLIVLWATPASFPLLQHQSWGFTTRSYFLFFNDCRLHYFDYKINLLMLLGYASSEWLEPRIGVSCIIVGRAWWNVGI